MASHGRIASNFDGSYNTIDLIIIDFDQTVTPIHFHSAGSPPQHELRLRARTTNDYGISPQFIAFIKTALAKNIPIAIGSFGDEVIDSPESADAEPRHRGGAPFIRAALIAALGEEDANKIMIVARRTQKWGEDFAPYTDVETSTYAQRTATMRDLVQLADKNTMCTYLMGRLGIRDPHKCLLIDDSDRNCSAWANIGGSVLTVPLGIRENAIYWETQHTAIVSAVRPTPAAPPLRAEEHMSADGPLVDLPPPPGGAAAIAAPFLETPVATKGGTSNDIKPA